jgi:hypothetical protein
MSGPRIKNLGCVNNSYYLAGYSWVIIEGMEISKNSIGIFLPERRLDAGERLPI